KNEIHVNQQKMTSPEDKRKKSRYTNKASKASKASNFYQTKKLLPAFHNAERQLIAYMLQDMSITDKVEKELGAAFNMDEHKIIVTHLYAFYEEGHKIGRASCRERV